MRPATFHRMRMRVEEERRNHPSSPSLRIHYIPTPESIRSEWGGRPSYGERGEDVVVMRRERRGERCGFYTRLGEADT